MNKLTKQLLSLGLSVVTVAGMVSPVFAEEVDETLENTTPIAEVSNETNVNERAALKTITVQLVIHEKGPYVYTDCVYKDVSAQVAQDATYGEIEDAIIKQCFPAGYVAVIAGKGGASGPKIYPLNEEKTIYAAECVKKENNGLFDPETSDIYGVNFIFNGEVVGMSSAFVEKGAQKVTNSQIKEIPTKYNLQYLGPDVEYDIIKDNGDGYIVNVPVIEDKDNMNYVNLHLLQKKNGKYEIYDAPYYSKATEFDLNGDSMITGREFKTFFEDRYKDIEVLYNDYALDSAVYDFRYNKANGSKYIEVFVEPKATTEKPETPTAPVTPTLPTDTNKLVKDSVALEANKELKAKYDEAVQNGATPEISVVSKDTAPTNDQKVLATFAKKHGLTESKAFTIDVVLVSDGETLGNLTELSSPLTLKVEIPKELKKAGRKFYVLRLHGDKITEIPVNEDGTFTTNQFSTYMLVYKDVAATKPSTGTTTTKPATQTKKDPVSKKDPKKNKTVNTGVQTAGTFFTGLMAASVAGFGVVEVSKRRNK